MLRSTGLGVAITLCGCASPTPPDARITPVARAAASPPRAGASTPTPSFDPERDPSGCRPALATPEPFRRPGPVYLTTRDAVFRLDASGVARVLEKHGHLDLSVATDGKVWVYDERGVYALTDAGKQPLPRIAPPVPNGWLEDLVVRSPSDVWGTVHSGEMARQQRWAIAHFDGATWTLTPSDALPTQGAPPDSSVGYALGMVATERSVFVATSHGLWQHAGAGWKRIPRKDPPSGLFAMRDRVVVGERNQADEMRDDAWKEIPRGFGWKTGGGTLALAPSGLVVWEQRGFGNVEPGQWIGTVDGDCGPSSISGLRGREPTGFAMDGRHRVWVSTSHGVVVLDRFGQVLADYAPGSLPGIDGETLVLAPSAGPDVLPSPRAPRRIDVVGHYRVGKLGPIVNAVVRLRISEDDVRESVTDSVGKFRLEGVPEGDYEVWSVETKKTHGCPFHESVGGFDLSTSKQCADTPDGGTCDVGVLTPCRRLGP